MRLNSASPAALVPSVLLAGNTRRPEPAPLPAWRVLVHPAPGAALALTQDPVPQQNPHAARCLWVEGVVYGNCWSSAVVLYFLLLLLI